MKVKRNNKVTYILIGLVGLLCAYSLIFSDNERFTQILTIFSNVIGNAQNLQ